MKLFHEIFATAFLTAIFLLSAPGFDAVAMEKGHAQPPDTADLKPDQYIWNPAASPAGPVGIIVDLTNQIIYVYRNGKQIGRSASAPAPDAIRRLPAPTRSSPKT